MSAERGRDDDPTPEEIAEMKALIRAEHEAEHKQKLQASKQAANFKKEN